MAVVFGKWPRFDVGVRGGIVAIVKCTPTVMCWTWTYSERDKNKSHGVQFCWPMPRVCVWRWCYWVCADLQILGDLTRDHPEPRQCSGTKTKKPKPKCKTLNMNFKPNPKPWS